MAWSRVKWGGEDIVLESFCTLVESETLWGVQHLCVRRCKCVVIDVRSWRRAHPQCWALVSAVVAQKGCMVSARNCVTIALT